MKLKKERGVLAALVVLSLAFAVYLTAEPEKCEGFECFQMHMVECSKAIYVNEEPEASWGYEIINQNSNLCEIRVTLLGAKEGNLNLRQYEGNSMSCFYDIGIIAYPEKDLDKCHGELKENLQSVIIENLYTYIVDNLGEIREELRRV